MKSPVQIIFPQPFAGVLKIAKSYPPNFIYTLNFSKVVFTSCDLGDFVVQSVDGTDYWLELWSFTVKKNGFLDILIPEPLIVVTLLFLGNLEGDLAGYGHVYTYSKTVSVFYIPAGNHQLILKNEEYLLLYFIPPPNSFEGMRIEHPGIEELVKRQSQKNTKATLLKGFPFPKDAWLKLKRMETVSQKVFALDLPLRRYMIELLNHYSEEIRKHELNLPSNPSSKEKAVALREYILANLHDSELGSVNELAKRFYIGIKTLTKEFKQLSGTTIHHYIVEQRLERAKKLLLETKLPLTDIATATGFTDTSHFIKRFKQKYGTTPRQKKTY
jgi:AraC-like DNA-binding protein